jgi:tetratricopeptide (TPR) repeat protein
VTSGAALVETGIRAFMRGDRREAERCWRAALAIDPQESRAREYLSSLAGTAAPEAPAAAAPPAEQRGAPTSAWDEVPAGGASISLGASGGLDFDALGHSDQPAFLPPEPAAPAATPDAAADVASWMQGAREMFALGDFTGSLELIERILAVDPENAEALGYLRENEETLVAMYESKLGPLEAVPRVQVRPEEILWLNLDHRAGFLLAQIGGTLSWEDVFSLSGLPRLDTARILARLVDDGVIAA